MYSFNGVYGFLAPTGAQEMLISVCLERKRAIRFRHTVEAQNTSSCLLHFVRLCYARINDLRYLEVAIQSGRADKIYPHKKSKSDLVELID